MLLKEVFLYQKNRKCVSEQPALYPAVSYTHLLDEIGGTELLVPEFLNALYALLESDVCCVGVIKSPQNLTSMMTRVEMKKQEAIKLQELHKDMTQQFHSVIVELTAFNREEVKLALKNFIKTEVCT